MITAARFPNGVEVRSSIELRAVGRRLEGVAAPFSVPTKVGSFAETIAPGAFTATLSQRGDVLALLDHAPDKLLARVSNGSLRLQETAAGLEFSLDVPATTLGADALAMAEAGLLGGVSIGFRTVKDAWTADRSKRTLLAVDLIELSLIQAFSAYPTNVQARHAGPVIDPHRRRRLALAAL